MTSKLTRERLQEIAEDGFLKHGESKELARMALVAMDSEPVKRVNADQMHHVCLEANRHLDKYGAMAKEVNKLLGRIPAQPAPVVPDDVLNRLEHEANHITAWHHMDEHSCKVNRRDLLTLVNSCRAAMLNAQPQNAPQNIPEIIPDGWIPVSEHLPKEKGVYQVWNGKYVDNVPFWFGSFQSLHSELITHWMPLPAAPQEVNHG